jgi:hypothetical protein
MNKALYNKFIVLLTSRLLQTNRKFILLRRERKNTREGDKKLGVTSILWMIYLLNFIDFICNSLFHGRVDVVLG